MDSKELFVDRLDLLVLEFMIEEVEDWVDFADSVMGSCMRCQSLVVMGLVEWW